MMKKSNLTPDKANLKLICGCNFHQIEFATFELCGELLMDVLIYKHRSEQTGKLYKNPKLLADVTLQPKDTKQLIDCIKSGYLS